MTNKDDKQTVREAIAVFMDPESLKNAVKDLIATGVSREQIGLLASEHSVRESLGDFYAHTNNSNDAKHGPVTAFVDKNSNSQQQQDSLGGSLFFAGTTGAMGCGGLFRGVWWRVAGSVERRRRSGSGRRNGWQNHSAKRRRLPAAANRRRAHSVVRQNHGC
ncbi:MAG: hypothetical protein CMQ34_13775 [Gammaproteobacteria bacterium]|nr:hypothetical protein [Gammaproteobacteria bacterium]|tara:strand:- start:2869 stop:3354 length:486 start_codon:yes stop_codon:yes gene_type:complete